MLRTVIIDNEPRTRAAIRRILSSIEGGIKLVGEASGVVSGIRAIRQLQPELVILDINLHEGSAFDLLELLPSIDFKIIFISANGSATAKAFKFNPVDYLLKPVNPSELADAVNRAAKQGP